MKSITKTLKINGKKYITDGDMIQLASVRDGFVWVEQLSIELQETIKKLFASWN